MSLDSFNTIEVSADNCILYTTTDGKVVHIYENNFFGANILSNTYENGLGKIVFDGKITSIGYNSFNSCLNLTKVVLPSSVTEIGEHAFSGCSHLISIEIPKNVTSIGKCSFFRCNSLILIDIPNSVKEIGERAFSGCKKLVKVYIGNSVSEIGDSAFEGCTSLEAFYGKFASEDNRCLIKDKVLISFAPAGLTSYTIPNNVVFIGGVFVRCKDLKSIKIPNSVREILSYAFAGCSGLTTLEIPNSVSYFGYSAFGWCTNLKMVVVPNTIKDFAYYAFQGCTGLEEIILFYTNPPKTGKYCLTDFLKETCVIKVPAELVNSYKKADYWKNFKDIVALTDEELAKYSAD